MSSDNFVRRGDVLDMIDAESHGGEGLAIIDSRDIHALPADPVAAAALALAEAVSAGATADYTLALELNDVPEIRAALAAYRSALAGRERGR